MPVLKRVEEPCPEDKVPSEYFGRPPGDATFIIIMKIHDTPEYMEIASEMCHENFMSGEFIFNNLISNFKEMFDEELKELCNYYTSYDRRNWKTIARYFFGKTCLQPQTGWYDSWVDKYRQENNVDNKQHWWD